MKKSWVYAFIFSILVMGVVLISSVNLDLNHDGVVNIQDLQLLASHYEGKLAYNSTYDLNGNGKVDLFDVVSVAKNIGVNTNGSVNGNVSSNRTVLFHSDWSTATGTSTAAVEDTGKSIHWTGLTNSYNHLNVTSAAPYFPNAGFQNVLVSRLLNDETASVAINTGDPAPSIGQSRYWREYLYVNYLTTTTSQSGGGNHPTADYDGADGDSESNRLWVLHIYYTQGSSKFGVWFQMEGGKGPPYDLGSVLSIQTPYRIEVKATKESGTTYKMDVRIYDSSDNLLYTGADFKPRYGGGTNLSGDTYNLTGSDLWSSFAVGTNGVTGWPSSNESAIYHVWGGAAMCDNDWCGPYSNGV